MTRKVPAIGNSPAKQAWNEAFILASEEPEFPPCFKSAEVPHSVPAGWVAQGGSGPATCLSSLSRAQPCEHSPEGLEEQAPCSSLSSDSRGLARPPPRPGR